jgi:hypothetical protein
MRNAAAHVSAVHVASEGCHGPPLHKHYKIRGIAHTGFTRVRNHRREKHRQSVPGHQPLIRIKATQQHCILILAVAFAGTASFPARSHSRRIPQEHAGILLHNALLPEHEINCAAHADRGPRVVPLQGLFHVQDHKRYKHREGDYLLEDFQLRQAHHAASNAVRGDLQKVLEECDAPARCYSRKPPPVPQVLQVRIPRESHEDVGQEQQAGGFRDVGHESVKDGTFHKDLSSEIVFLKAALKREINGTAVVDRRFL